MKLVFVESIFIIGFSLLANAAPVGCNPYQSPISQAFPYLQKIVYFDNNPPMCADDFLAFLRNDRANVTKSILWEKALRIAQKNVRILYCTAGKMNVVFLNKKVFLTNAHAFHFLDKTSQLATKRFSDQDIHNCFVMNGKQKNHIDISTPPDMGKSGEDISYDYAVGAVEQSIDDIVPIELASPDDYLKNQELMVASAYRGNEIGRNCFSAALCNDRKFWGAINDLASVHSTNCPEDVGSSASAVFLISASGKIVLSQLVAGGSPYDSNTRNGRPYFYTRDQSDPRAAFNLNVGIDGVFREKIDAFEKKIESKNPPGSLVPHSHIRSADYGPEGQEL